MNPCSKLLHYIIYLKFYLKYNLLYIRTLIHIENSGGEIVRILSGWLAWLTEGSTGLRRKTSFVLQWMDLDIYLKS